MMIQASPTMQQAYLMTCLLNRDGLFTGWRNAARSDRSIFRRTFFACRMSQSGQRQRVWPPSVSAGKASRPCAPIRMSQRFVPV
jgi:hypothetical protein